MIEGMDEIYARHKYETLLRFRAEAHERACDMLLGKGEYRAKAWEITALRWEDDYVRNCGDEFPWRYLEARTVWCAKLGWPEARLPKKSD
jgi:hypothetical protein